MIESTEVINISGNDLKNLKIILDYLLETEETDYKEYVANDLREFLNNPVRNISIKEFYKTLNSGHIYETILNLVDNIFPENKLNNECKNNDLSDCQRKEQHYECYGILWQCSKCKIIICCAEGTDTGNEELDNLCDKCWAEG